MQEEFVSTKEAAKLLNVTIRTIRRYIKNGTLNFKRFPDTPRGRIYIYKTDIPTFLRK